MAIYNAEQIASLLQQQGVPKEKIPVMTAIGLAESSGRSQAFNPRGLDKSYGLFQVNMYGGLGPARMKQFGLKSEQELFDPATNARAAKAILDSQGLGAWTTYTSGKYKQFLPGAQQAAGNLTQQPASNQERTQPGKDMLVEYLKQNNELLSELINKKDTSSSSSGYGFLNEMPDISPVSLLPQTSQPVVAQKLMGQLMIPTSYV